jgi:hypothetical protein
VGLIECHCGWAPHLDRHFCVRTNESRETDAPTTETRQE